ncbi:MAG: YgaP family membrane protein [Candidatus Hydrothermia bacterium]|jgi:hypothetical protein
MNVGTLDAIIRAIVGWFLIHMNTVLKIKMAQPLKIILIILGLILIITSVTRYCGLYTLLKVSTM